MDASISATMVGVLLRDSTTPQRTSLSLTLAGHAGAMLQARRLGKELLVGVHSDKAILENKGPTVMTLQERFVAL